MKAAGVERDREIAEARGEPKGCNDIVECESPIGCNSACGCYGYKPYSTDISAAMELWEEMTKSSSTSYVELLSDGKGETPANCSIYFIQRTGRKGTESHSGETEADAISGCYLKWKGAE